MKCDAKYGFPRLSDPRFLIFNRKNGATFYENEPLVFLTKDFLFRAVGVFWPRKTLGGLFWLRKNRVGAILAAEKEGGRYCGCGKNHAHAHILEF